MSAGLSHKQLYDTVYRRLHKIQRKLAQQGYQTTYKERALFHAGLPVVWFRIIRASNGEVGGILNNDTGLTI